MSSEKCRYVFLFFVNKWFGAEYEFLKIRVEDNLSSKEKHSLTRKLVGYMNWRQGWCKKEGNKVLGKDK